MDNNYMMLFDIISIGAGIYCIITWFKLRLAGGRLFPNSLLVPKDFKTKDCKDPEIFTAYIGPRILIFGILVLIYGILSIVDTLFAVFNPVVRSILYFSALAMVVWFGFVSTKANRRHYDIGSKTTPPKHL